MSRCLLCAVLVRIPLSHRRTGSCAVLPCPLLCSAPAPRLCVRSDLEVLPVSVLSRDGAVTHEPTYRGSCEAVCAPVPKPPALASARCVRCGRVRTCSSAALGERSCEIRWSWRERRWERQRHSAPGQRKRRRAQRTTQRWRNAQLFLCHEKRSCNAQWYISSIYYGHIFSVQAWTRLSLDDSDRRVEIESAKRWHSENSASPRL